jgi:hypothetical protein
LSLMVSKPNSRRDKIMLWDGLLTGLCERRSRLLSERERMNDVLWKSAIMWLTVAALLSVDRDKYWSHNKSLIYFRKKRELAWDVKIGLLLSSVQTLSLVGPLRLSSSGRRRSFVMSGVVGSGLCLFRHLLLLPPVTGADCEQVFRMNGPESINVCVNKIALLLF